MGSTGHNSTFFQKMVMLHIKLKGITNSAAWSQILCLQSIHPLTQGLGSKGRNSTFLSEHCHVACQIKGNHEMQQHSSKYFARRPPPPSSRHDPRGWGQKVKVQLFQNMAMLHIKFKGITNYTDKVANIFPADPPPH